MLFLGGIDNSIKPIVLSSYVNNTDKMIFKSLTLSSDRVFFAYSNCECGTERFTKGKWKLEGDYLYLNSLPKSAYSIYPEIKKIYYKEPSDSVDIIFSNYFDQPISASILAYKQSDSLFNPVRLNFDSLGHIRLSKKEYSGFMMEYDPYREFSVGEDVGTSIVDTRISKICIKADFDFASYDRQLIQENIGNIRYKRVGDKLYTEEGKLAYELVN